MEEVNQKKRKPDITSFFQPKQTKRVKENSDDECNEKEEVKEEEEEKKKNGKEKNGNGDDGDGDGDVDYSKMTVNALKDILREKGLPVSGSKAVLLERLNKGNTSNIKQKKTKASSTETNDEDGDGEGDGDDGDGEENNKNSNGSTLVPSDSFSDYTPAE